MTYDEVLEKGLEDQIQFMYQVYVCTGSPNGHLESVEEEEDRGYFLTMEQAVVCAKMWASGLSENNWVRAEDCDGRWTRDFYCNPSGQMEET